MKQAVLGSQVSCDPQLLHLWFPPQLVLVLVLVLLVLVVLVVLVEVEVVEVVPVQGLVLPWRPRDPPDLPPSLPL